MRSKKKSRRRGAHASAADSANKTVKERFSDSSSGKTELSGDAKLEAVRKWIKKVRFKKALFGVSETDVWKKIAELNQLYEAALTAERVRFNVLLKERVAMTARYMEQQYAPQTKTAEETENPSEGEA